MDPLQEQLTKQCSTEVNSQAGDGLPYSQIQTLKQSLKSRKEYSIEKKIKSLPIKSSSQEDNHSLSLNEEEDEENNKNKKEEEQDIEDSEQYYADERIHSLCEDIKDFKVTLFILLGQYLLLVLQMVLISLFEKYRNYIYKEYIGLSIAAFVGLCCFYRYYYFNEKKTRQIIILFILSYVSIDYLYQFSHAFLYEHKHTYNLAFFFFAFISGDLLVLIIFSYILVQKDRIILITIIVIHALEMIILMITVQQYPSVAVASFFSYFYTVIISVFSKPGKKRLINHVYEATRLWLVLSVYIFFLLAACMITMALL